MLAHEEYVFWGVTVLAQLVVAVLVVGVSVSDTPPYARLTTVLVSGPLWVFAARVQCAVDPLPDLGSYCWASALVPGVVFTLAQLCIQTKATARGLQLAPLLYLCGVREWLLFTSVAVVLFLALTVPTCCLQERSTHQSCCGRFLKALALTYNFANAAVLSVTSAALFSAGAFALVDSQEWQEVTPTHASSAQLVVWTLWAALGCALALWREWRHSRPGYTPLKDSHGTVTQLTAV